MEYYNYVEALDTVQRNMTNLIDLYRRYPQNEQLGNYAHKIIRELYQKTVTILDMKRQEEGSLSAEEQQIYESCKKELDNKNLRGLLRIFGWTMISAMIDAYESIYHLLPAGKAEGKVQNLLFKSGGEVLRVYRIPYNYGRYV